MNTSFKTDLKSFYAGDSVTINHFFDNYNITAAAGYALKYVFVSTAINQSFSSVYDASKRAYVFNLSAALTSLLTKDNYQVFAVLEADDFSKTLQVSSVFVNEDIRLTASKQSLSHARKMLKKIEAILEDRDNDVQSYSINGRNVSRMDVDKLTKMRDYYRNEVAAEEYLQNGRPKNKGNTINIIWDDR